MMSSNILSRFLPPNDSPSVYEAIREHDAGSDSSDIEDRAGMMPEDIPRETFSDLELEDVLADAQESQISNPSAALLGERPPQKVTDHFASPVVSRRRKPSRPRWMRHQSPSGYELDDHDEDVPQSLLVEGHDDEELRSRLPPPPQSMPSRSRTPSPRPSPHPDQPHWNEPQVSRPSETHIGNHFARWFVGQQHPSLAFIDPKKKSMWRWANVEDLDNFLKDVYIYFLGNGFWSILLSRALNLLYVIKRTAWCR